jgi:hypothetical protein
MSVVFSSLLSPISTGNKVICYFDVVNGLVLLDLVSRQVFPWVAEYCLVSHKIPFGYVATNKCILFNIVEPHKFWSQQSI